MDTIEALVRNAHENEIISEAVLADLAKDRLMDAIKHQEKGDIQESADFLYLFLAEVISNIRDATGADGEVLEDPGVMDNGMHEKPYRG